MQFEVLAAMAVLAGGLLLWVFKRRAANHRDVPSVSVLVVVNNQAAVVEGFLREAWRLVAGAGGARGDLVVVDDASVDETPKILEQLGRTLPALKLAHWRPGVSPGGSAVELGYFLCSHPAIALLHLKDAEKTREFLRILQRLFRSDPRARPHGSASREPDGIAGA